MAAKRNTAKKSGRTGRAASKKKAARKKASSGKGTRKAAASKKSGRSARKDPHADVVYSDVLHQMRSRFLSRLG